MSGASQIASGVFKDPLVGKFDRVGRKEAVQGKLSDELLDQGGTVVWRFLDGARQRFICGLRDEPSP